MKLGLVGGGGRMGEAIKALHPAKDYPFADASKIDVVVDFSSPEGCVKALAFCRENGIPFVTGTTGIEDAQQAEIKATAADIAIVQSGNMSLGITVLKHLVATAAKSLEGFDIEILETHHRHKKDSPSGTALLLGEAAARARGTALSEAAHFGRHGRDEARKAEEIGFAVRRGGGVFGEHEVGFYADGETISLGHMALSRETFASGAIKAAEWVIGKPAGLYGMDDVLGLSR
ncbi:4-hydroxy-tetrahydrodipicolinate reductase [Parvularcula sp. ZS-1/3]|uniref:4-hydroxy-tetrahydrodipicolinate reductase n=1 Tax=Parvularcula mediterranea TaxID=2732508 RepID=A0A7Y3RKS3_9PROT|nr:4-hydroxy-tetrahydrodipicolinate reductase [Parvularcula mediterranea]NNU15874.1 4-hydroxy-tetrahydrodipicolinate reductase [Parvularcula mediterranea]